MESNAIKNTGEKVATNADREKAMEWLRREVTTGMTAKDLGAVLRCHHGKASGILSLLHKDGRVVLLKSRRDGFGIYTLPAYVYGRETRPRQTRKSAEAWKAEIAAAAKAAYDEGWLQGVDDAATPVTREPALV